MRVNASNRDKTGAALTSTEIANRGNCELVPKLWENVMVKISGNGEITTFHRIPKTRLRSRVPLHQSPARLTSLAYFFSFFATFLLFAP